MNSTKKRVSSTLTSRLTQLHSEGYIYDFALKSKNTVMCLQSNAVADKTSFTVKLVDQIYDQLCNNYQYIHVIETDCGEKGILMLPEIYFDKIVLN
ncbi:MULTISPECIES: hypothetical protein [unclassified Mucilaginibacter]|uniref:hypothetical protein n=1 Tax=unclassified Mucilaginibacter TaxID=2617802 RepID=UPI00096A0C92|nr:MULTISPECIES: hypothetical protein [unclassified Mucilaginibacter]OJW14324.1 MAG: hypothetical protein BGO48_09345 [Mucilaginibacter sp. 44-25]PLW88582.1 MAG: hypothetical protein C0154_15815 [Mucilaginibacter sp.]HEK19420.1 hypothetical protein [Bacteroidota bacterium]